MKPAPLLLLVALSACGAYPQPFAGNPGRVGARLSLPPPPRLIVTRPTNALLADRSATEFAADIADALAAQEVPAVTTPGTGADWRLTLSAALTAGRVIPTYAVLNPKGVPQGSVSGKPISPDTWAQAAPTALALVAKRDAPAIAALLTGIEGTVQQNDPNSLTNRPPRVMLAGVTGAPGDGNTSLRTSMAHELAGAGLMVQSAAPGADFQISGTVRVVPSSPGQSRVEIQWTVLDPYGHEAGHLLQMNDVPAGSLNGYWGEVATAVAQEAAGGVRDVITNQTVAHRIGSAKPPSS